MKDKGLNRVPKIGDAIIYFPGENDKDVKNNGADYLPGVIVRTWGDHLSHAVNAKIAPDGPGMFWRTSIMHGSNTGILSSADLEHFTGEAFYLFPDEIKEDELKEFFGNYVSKLTTK